MNLTNGTCMEGIEWTSRFLMSSVVYGLVLVVGLPLNTVSLWILLRRHGLRSSCAVLMIHLAASDLLLALSLPLRVYFYATLRWPFGVATCTAAVILFRINIRTSCMFITLISVDRLCALVFPLRSRPLRTAAFACKCCCLVWILTTFVCALEGVTLHNALTNQTCGFIPCFEFHKARPSAALSQAIFLLILLVINVVSTALVIFALRKRPRDEATRVKNKMSVVLIFVVNMMVFVVFFMPFAFQLMAANYEKHDGEVLRALVCLASVNCCLDPLIYYFSLDSFWQDKGQNQGDGATYSLSRSVDRS